MALTLALIIPHLVQLYAVRGENWGSTGPRTGIVYFWDNFRVNALYYFANLHFPVLFTLVFFLGMVLKRNLREKIFLLIWFLLFWGIFLFFYAGSYRYGQDVRFSLVSYMPIALLGGSGLSKLWEWFQRQGLGSVYLKASVVVILIIFIGFLPHIRAIGEEACQARADHYYAQKMAEQLPDNAMVLTHNPNMFLVWGKNAAQTAVATHSESAMNYFFDRYTGGVYFHFNYWCNVNNERERNFCRTILERYQHELLAHFTESGYTFALYRLYKKQN